MESNDSPEIPDRKVTSDIPGLFSGGERASEHIQRERDFQDKFKARASFTSANMIADHKD